MKRRKNVALLVAFLVAVCALSFTAFGGVKKLPRWSYFMSIMGGMEVQDNGKASVIVDVTANEDKVDKIQVVCRVQQLKDGSWKTLKSWTETSDEGAPGSVAFEKTYYIEKGYSYRVQLVTKAYKDGSVKENLTNNFDYGYFH